MSFKLDAVQITTLSAFVVILDDHPHGASWLVVMLMIVSGAFTKK